MTDTIRQALAQLDIENDDHWTTDGLPRLDVLKELAGQPVSRSDISQAAHGFSRKTPNLENEKPESTDSGEIVDAPTTKPEETETEEAPSAEENETEEGVEGEVVLNNDEAIEAELAEARKLRDEAQKRFDKAQAAMDEVIIRRSREQSNGRNPAHDVQAYQKAQAAQRAATAENRKLMAQAAKANKTKY